jgi:hypothetical protein
MILLKYANLALAFLLELCALAELGYWEFVTGGAASEDRPRRRGAAACSCNVVQCAPP